MRERGGKRERGGGGKREREGAAGKRVGQDGRSVCKRCLLKRKKLSLFVVATCSL